MGNEVDVADRSEAAGPRVVLLVEDSAMVRIPAAHYLRHVGYTVIEAGNADEAVHLIESGLSIDIVFSDIQMNGSMDGNGLASYLAKERPGLPVILTSGTAVAVMENAERAPRRFLRKPYDMAVLETLIRDLVDEFRR
jgi:DNA-binding NtrC family response regulator